MSYPFSFFIYFFLLGEINMKRLDQTPKTLEELESTIKALLIKEELEDNYNGYINLILKLEKSNNLFYRILRFIGYRDGEREYVYRHSIVQSYNKKLPTWVNVILYLIICNIDYADVYSEETVEADSIFNPRYSELLNYIKQILTQDKQIKCDYLLETNSSYIGVHVKKHFPIINRILEKVPFDDYIDLLPQSLNVLMTICFTNSPNKCLLKDDNGFYITNLYISLHNEKKGFTDKIHLSIVNESIGEEMHLILVQETDKDGDYVKRQLELKGKDIDILRVKEFYNLLS